MQEHGHSGHIVDAQRVRASGTLDALARVVTASSSRAARRLSGGLNAFARSPPARESGVEDTWDEADECWAEAAAIEPQISSAERIISAQWYTIDSRRLLLLVYATGVQIWQAQADLDGFIEEIANLHESGVLAARLASLRTGSPVLFIVTAASDSRHAATLKLYSVQTHEVLSKVAISGQLVDLQANARVVAVACCSPAAIHLFSADTLKPIKGSPIKDVPATPVFTLSRGRSIAYASTSASAETNILAHKGKWAKAPERPSSSQGSEVAELARRAVVSGAKVIGDIGVSLAHRTAYSRSAPAQQTHERPERGASHVKVLDTSTMRTLAHFKPTERTVAFISIDPSGNALLACSGEARAFHVFELRGNLQPVWHRYDLIRGATFGKTEQAAWSEDGRFVAVSTARGTAHVYAISPCGGVPDVRQHFATAQVNSEELPPLSTTMPALTRIRAPRELMPTQNQEMALLDGSHAPVMTFTANKSGSRSIVLLYPHLGTLIHDRLSIGERTAAQASVSGLTQMMRGRQGTDLEAIVKLEHVSSWPLQRSHDWPEVRKAISTTPIAERLVTRNAAQAELHTFNLSIKVNPASIYASHQFDFFSFSAKPVSARFTRGDLTVANTKRIELRRHVDVTRAADNGQLEDALMARSVRAMSRSPPSFPNAVPGARGPPLWQRTIQSLSSQRSASTSSPSSTPCSLTFEDDSAVRDVEAAHTPGTEPTDQLDDDDTKWGFDDLATTLPAQIRVSPVEAQEHTPFEMDEHGVEDTLQPPIEPKAVEMKREVSGGRKKRKGRQTPSPASIHGRSPA